MYWKYLSPRVLLPILGTRKIKLKLKLNSKTLLLKDSSVRSIWTQLKASPCWRATGRVEMKQLREVWRSYTGAETMWKQMRAILSWIRLLIGSQWRPESKGVMWADLGTVQMRRAKQLITLWSLEPARRVLQQSSLERTREETRDLVASNERYRQIKPIRLISR